MPPNADLEGTNLITKPAAVPRLIPNDYNSIYQWNLEKVQTPEGWAITQGSSSKIIAVVDSGVDYNHPDLSSKVIKGHDYYQNDEDPMDEWWHGTAVAGVAAAATDNAQGIAGLAWKPKILAIRYYKDDTDNGTVYNMARGLLQASVSGADVITFSSGFGDHDDFFFQSLANVVINQKKIVVAPTGDYDKNDTTCHIGYPASYNLVIAVSGTDSSDHFVLGCRYPSWTPPGYGRDLGGIDVAAPAADFPSTDLGGGYRQVWGVSFSTPMVAGVAAMMLSCNSDADIVKHALLSTADDIETTGYDLETGWGRINLYKALSAVCNPNPQISLTANPNPTLGAPVNVQVKATDPNSDLNILYYADNITNSWSRAMPGVDQNCNSSVCSITKYINPLPANGKYKLTAVAYDNAGHRSTFCAYGCPDNDEVLGNNNYLELTVVNGLTNPTPANSIQSAPPHLDNLTTSSGSVIVNLNWTDSYGENGYIIQKGIGPLPTFADFAEVGEDVTEYHDHLPVSQEGSTITYRIRARFIDNSTSLSNQQTVNAPIVTPSAFPIEATTTCNDQKVKVSLSWGALAQGTNYKIYFKYKTASDQLLTIIYAPDAYAGLQLTHNWQTNWGSLADNDLVVHIVAQTPGGSIDSSHISVAATDCQPSPPPTPIDPPGTGTLTVTQSCSTWHPWANADWSVRHGYTGKYKAQYKLSSQGTWTDSLSGAISETWDMIYLTSNGTYNIRIITTADNQVWANPITVSVSCETPIGSLQVSYRCSNNTPVADFSWTPAPYYHDYNDLMNYYIRYEKPGGGWTFGIELGPNETFTSTEDSWSGEPLASGQIWGWKVKARYWGESSIEWGGPVYVGPIPYCPPGVPQVAGMHKSPTTAFNWPVGPSGASRSWSYPNNIINSNNISSWTTLNPNSGTTSYYLAAMNFGFNIPADATIDGIRVAVERRKSGTTTVIDASTRLIKNGSLVGQDKANMSTGWPTNDTYKAYGGPSDLWNTTLTPADINSQTFGVAFAANIDGQGGDVTAYVDHIWVTVYYTVPISLLSPCNTFADINSDGKVNTYDSDLITKYINGQTSFTNEQRRRADVNGDGIVDQTDIDRITAYLDSAEYTFQVCEDPDNDGLPNYEDMDDDGNGAIDPPTVSITINNKTIGTTTVTAGQPFTITVTSTSPIGIGFIWWFGQNTGITDATVTNTYPTSPTSPTMACADVVNPTKLDRTFCSPVFSAEQKVTFYSFTSTVIINQPGTYHFGVNARDVLYPIPGEAHQASEGVGIQVVEVQNLPPNLGDTGNQSVIEGQSLSITLSATDPDNDPLIYSVTGLPQGANFSGQTLSWTPSYEQSGTYDVTFTVSDGKLTDSKKGTISVLNDQDKDGFADSLEIYIGTDPLDACPDNKWDSCWPPDLNNDRVVNNLDMNILNSKITNGLGHSKYDRRYDLNADSKVDFLDISVLKSYMGKTCR